MQAVTWLCLSAAGPAPSPGTRCRPGWGPGPGPPSLVVVGSDGCVPPPVAWETWEGVENLAEVITMETQRQRQAPVEAGTPPSQRRGRTGRWAGPGPKGGPTTLYWGWGIPWKHKYLRKFLKREKGNLNKSSEA